VLYLTRDEEVHCALLASGKNLTRRELDNGVRRDVFWNTPVAPRFNDATVQLSFPGLYLSSASAEKRNRSLELKPSVFRRTQRTGEDLRANFFRIRALFSECHRRWSHSGQMYSDAFPDFLPVRPGGGSSNDGQKALVLLQALRCEEPGEDMDALKFATKIAPACARIELGTKESSDIPSSTLRARPKKRKVEERECGMGEEEDLLQVMNKAAESMTAGSSAENIYSTKRWGLGEQRKTETKSLLKLLSQMREIRESGLSAEDPYIIYEVEIEIKCCKDRLRHFRKEEEELR
jgi:hypothetical protein